MPTPTLTLTLTPALTLALALTLAACGPAPTPVGPPPLGSTEVPVALDGGVPPPAPDGGATAVGPAFDMKPIAASSTVAADLQGIGLDPKSLPAMGKLEPEKLRKVMKLMARALGAKCSDCHLEDMHATTPRKKIAEKMWNDYARALTAQDGAPVFCDTCHQGRLTFLDRRDRKPLGHWMDENLVDRLKRKDGKPHECATCHGEEMSYRFLEPLRR